MLYNIPPIYYACATKKNPTESCALKTYTLRLAVDLHGVYRILYYKPVRLSGEKKPPTRYRPVVTSACLRIIICADAIFRLFIYYFFSPPRTGGRNVSRGREKTPRLVESHHARVVAAGRVHAQEDERAAEKFLSGEADVQRGPARRLRGHAKPGRGLGTGGFGPGSGEAVVREGLQEHHVQTESREYIKLI